MRWNRRLWRWMRGIKVHGEVRSDAVITAFYAPEGNRKEQGMRAAIRRSLRKGKATSEGRVTVLTGKGG